MDNLFRLMADTLVVITQSGFFTPQAKIGQQLPIDFV